MAIVVDSAASLPEDLARLMRRSGCWYTHLGVESGNPETLRGIRKKITVEQVEHACRTLSREGIKKHALFMLYNVWEEDGRLRFEDGALTPRGGEGCKGVASSVGRVMALGSGPPGRGARWSRWRQTHT